MILYLINNTMKIYSNKNVFDAALDRIRYLFDEFHDVIVCCSGGKDSTVCLNLSLMVAKEKNRLALKVLFIDQEACWDSVIDYMRTIMNKSCIESLWFQIPLKLYNASSESDPLLYSWEIGKKWMREKEVDSIKENKYGTYKFTELFTSILKRDFAEKVCYIAGVRCEETPTRFVALTEPITYKWITWGKILTKEYHQYTFYPIYDWSYTDVWKAIYDHKWRYCKVYDYMYQCGIPLSKMRVSHFLNRTSISDLLNLQKIEPGTWDKLVKRIGGVNASNNLGSDYFTVENLPYMFNSWKEYRDYLLEALIVKDHHHKFKHIFDKIDSKYPDRLINLTLCKVCIKAILMNDYRLITVKRMLENPKVHEYKKWKHDEFTDLHKNGNRFIEDSIVNAV